MAMRAQTRLWIWPWLLIGLLLLPFVAYQSIVPLAARLAPTFLLRFVRTAPSARVTLPLIFVAYALSILVDARRGRNRPRPGFWPRSRYSAASSRRCPTPPIV